MSYFSTTKIGKMFLGSVEIAKAYFGSTLVFQKGGHVPITDEITVVPSKRDTVNSVYNNWNNPTRGYTDTTSTTYSQANLTHGAGAETHIYYGFDFSTIPSNATINSVTVKAKAYISNIQSANIASRGQNVCKGTTPAGADSAVNNSTSTVRTLDAGDSWTRAELDTLQVHVFATRTSANVTTTYYIRFYGAEVTVNYTY